MDRRLFLKASTAGAAGVAAAAALPGASALAAVKSGNPRTPAAPAVPAAPVTPSITDMYAKTALAPIICIERNKNHDYIGGRSHGLWIDGPMNVYRGGNGKQFAIFPHAQNFRYTVGDYEDQTTYRDLAFVHGSNYDLEESHYDYATWLFGCWAEGNTVYAVAHHEWHLNTVDVDGLPLPISSFPNRRYQTRGIKWYKSTDNGSSWNQKTAGNARRLFAVPEPYGMRKASVLYGWLQPSANIVKEHDGKKDYYYFTVQAYNLGKTRVHGKDLRHVIAGFSLFRTSDLDDIDAVEFYNTKKEWEPRAHSGYQGSLSAQQPHIFFALAGYDPYEGTPAGAKNRVAQCIRYHDPTQQWLIFGYQGGTPDLCYGRTATLADPQFKENGLTRIGFAGTDTNSDYSGEAYMNVFDPDYDLNDQNMMKIGNTPMLVVGYKQKAYKSQRLQIVTG